MASVSDAVEAGRIARDDAERRLLARGIDPAKYPRLLDELRHATEQVVAAHEHGRDVREYHDHVDAIYAQLDADPVDGTLPRPPKRRLALRW